MKDSQLRANRLGFKKKIKIPSVMSNQPHIAFYSGYLSKHQFTMTVIEIKLIKQRAAQ